MDIDIHKQVEEIASFMTDRGIRLSLAESCTGGFISNAITDIPGASQFFDMSVISYSIHSKKTVLGISTSKLDRFGTVSEETAILMAKAIKKKSKTDISLAVTGVAGPEKTENKEIGLIYMAVATEDLVESKGIQLIGTREDIKKQASIEALRLLSHVLRIWF